MNEQPAVLEELVDLAKLAAPPMTPLQQERGLAAVADRLAARRRHRRRWFALGLAGAGAAVCAVLLALFSTGTRQPPSTGLGYHAEGGEILEGGYLRSFDNQGMGLLFAEGSRLDLFANARARLRSVDAWGACFAIEQGAARVHVTHRLGARWLVDAGPFLITVQGTLFTVAWDASNERLDLRLEQGLVSVTGPVSAGTIAVRTGQRLTIDLAKKEVLLREIDAVPAPAILRQAEPALAPEPTAGPAIPPAPPDRTREQARPGTPLRASPPFGWAIRLATGDVEAILHDVRRIGLRRSLAEASSEDLSALADAARYLRQDDVARQALLAQRSRFAGSRRARAAAFFLGRLEESRAGGEGKALEWYNDYLEAAPSGTYASEALGRKMMATQKLVGAEAARMVAQEYLRRFPGGTYAGAARALGLSP